MAKRKTPTPPLPGQEAAPTAETPTQKLDRLTQAAIAPLTGGLSPVSLGLATADWAWHLALSPGRQLELTALAARLTGDTLRQAVSGATDETALPAADDADLIARQVLDDPMLLALPEHHPLAR